MMLLLTAWACLSAQALTDALPLSGLQLNKKLQLHVLEGSVHDQGATGFQATFKNQQFEVQLKGVALPSEDVARQKAAMEFSNIQNLYKPRSNPYMGQVSDLVQCGKDLLPKISKMKVNGQTVRLLTGGASERKILGACAHDQIGYWAGYFQFFYKGMAVEARLFLPVKSAANLEQGQRQLAKWAEELLVVGSPP